MDMNNEMDELFRKAGEDYPLNLGKPDWDAVAGKLQTDTGDLGPGFGMTAAVPRKQRRLLWLLLLLPLGIYGVTMLVGSGKKRLTAGSWQTAKVKNRRAADNPLMAAKLLRKTRVPKLQAVIQHRLDGIHQQRNGVHQQRTRQWRKRRTDKRPQFRLQTRERIKHPSGNRPPD